MDQEAPISPPEGDSSLPFQVSKKITNSFHTLGYLNSVDLTSNIPKLKENSSFTPLHELWLGTADAENFNLVSIN